MATTALVETLKTVFREAKSEGVVIDAIGLAPAYHGMVKDRYTLGVSIPIVPPTETKDKMEIVFNIIWRHLTMDERRFIDRVRVFDSIEELEDHKYNDFEQYPYEGYFGIQRKLPELYPID